MDCKQNIWTFLFFWQKVRKIGKNRFFAKQKHFKKDLKIIINKYSNIGRYQMNRSLIRLNVSKFEDNSPVISYDMIMDVERR